MYLRQTVSGHLQRRILASPFKLAVASAKPIFRKARTVEQRQVLCRKIALVDLELMNDSSALFASSLATVAARSAAGLGPRGRSFDLCEQRAMRRVERIATVARLLSDRGGSDANGPSRVIRMSRSAFDQAIEGGEIGAGRAVAPALRDGLRHDFPPIGTGLGHIELLPHPVPRGSAAKLAA